MVERPPAPGAEAASWGLVNERLAAAACNRRMLWWSLIGCSSSLPALGNSWGIE